MSGEWEEMERAASQRTRAAIFLGAALALAFCVFLRYYGEQPTQQAASSSADTTELSTTVIEQPPLIRAPPTVAGDATASNAVGTRRVGIYECLVNGQRVVSDRPCAPDAQPRTLLVDESDPQDAMAARQRTQRAQQQSASSYAAPSRTAGRTSEVVDVAGNASRCAQIDQEVDQINARMRDPYTSEEGDRLRGRWHQLKDERYELRCGR